jgi:hypothetical protein
MDSTTSGASGSSRMPASLLGGLEAAAELAAGLVPHLDDLEDGHGPIQMDAAAAQAGQLPGPRPLLRPGAVADRSRVPTCRTACHASRSRQESALPCPAGQSIPGR